MRLNSATILHRALRKAKKNNLISVNVAIDLDGKRTPLGALLHRQPATYSAREEEFLPS